MLAFCRKALYMYASVFISHHFSPSRKTEIKLHTKGLHFQLFFFISIGNWTRFNLASSLPLQKLALLLIIRLSMNTPECPWSWAERTSPWRERGGGRKVFPSQDVFLLVPLYLRLSVGYYQNCQAEKSGPHLTPAVTPPSSPRLPFHRGPTSEAAPWLRV